MICLAKERIENQYHPDGYYIGEAVGQTVMYVHIHVIPRYQGDMENSRGVEGVQFRKTGVWHKDTYQYMVLFDISI